MIMFIVFEKPTGMFVVCRLAFGRADLWFKYVKKRAFLLSRLNESGARGPTASYASGSVC